VPRFQDEDAVWLNNGWIMRLLGFCLNVLQAASFEPASGWKINVLIAYPFVSGGWIL
jgi:hypothetical protein